jgi:hypothetical protein
MRKMTVMKTETWIWTAAAATVGSTRTKKSRGVQRKRGQVKNLPVSCLCPVYEMQLLTRTERKRSATTAETFGSTLTALLAEPTKKAKKSAKVDDESAASAPKKSKTKQPTAKEAILSLSQTRLPPSRAEENLERKAKRHIQALKEEKEDRARIRNVLEGWSASSISTPNGEVVVGGQEFEKSLRKTAQRGGTYHVQLVDAQSEMRLTDPQ